MSFCLSVLLSIKWRRRLACLRIGVCFYVMEEAASVPVHLSKQEEEEAPVSIDLCVYLSLPLSTYVNRGGG